MKYHVHHNNIILSVLLIFQIVLIYFLPLNITSGDGPELVTVIALNGIAHPSGYPFYTILAKLLTFIPFGTIAFRISLFSSLCGIISLYLIAKIVYLFTDDTLASIFSMESLFLSYMFFYQSLFQKFYPLNLLIILFLFYLGIICLKHNYSKNIQYLIFFILGIAFSCHHTALLMILPFTFLAIYYFKDFLKNLMISIFFFFVGSIINIYIFIKLSHHKFTFFPINTNFKNVLFDYIFRGIYKNTSSISLMKSLILSVSSYLYSFINSLKVIQANYPLYFTYLFFILGCLFLYKKNRKIFVFSLLTFITYSIILAKLTFSKKNPTVFDYYILANQYFLPTLAFFSIFSGIGFFYLKYYVKKRYKSIYYLICFIPLFYLIIFPIRLNDNLWSKNLAVYQSRIDKLFAKPINIFYVTSGDNPVFQTAYLKKIAKFRNDICNLMYFGNDKSFFLNCFFKKRMDEYKSIKLENFLISHYNDKFPNIYSSENIKNDLRYFYVYKNISDYILIYKGDILQSEKGEFYPIFKSYCGYDFYKSFFEKSVKLEISNEFYSNIIKLQKKFQEFYNYYPCLEHSTDDYFTYGDCFAAYVRNNFISQEIKDKIVKYNSSIMPYIYVDKRLQKEFERIIINEIQIK